MQDTHPVIRRPEMPSTALHLVPVSWSRHAQPCLLGIVNHDGLERPRSTAATNTENSYDYRRLRPSQMPLRM